MTVMLVMEYEQEYTLQQILPKDEYALERKYDGERLEAIVHYDQITLLNRENEPRTGRFPEVVENLQLLKVHARFDGELAYFYPNTDKEDRIAVQGRATLRNQQKIKLGVFTTPLTYVVFDILEYEGVDTRTMPYTERRKLLEKVLGREAHRGIRLVESITRQEDKLAFWGRVKAEGWEGIVLKKKDSPYVMSRSAYWVRCKHRKQEIVKFTGYEVQPMGLTLTNPDGVRVAVNGQQHKEVKAKIDLNGYAYTLIEYLYKTADGMFFQITYQGLAEAKK